MPLKIGGQTIRNEGLVALFSELWNVYLQFIVLEQGLTRVCSIVSCGRLPEPMEELLSIL